MAKEDSKKWLVILIVLVAVSLVVDLLSLNVLYSLSNTASSSSKGALASYGGGEYSSRGQPDPYCVAECDAKKAACETDSCKIDVCGKTKGNGVRVEKNCDWCC